ncbi:hypothetical protein LIER_15113 [Lithospermum erythrorhizon]|uniref:Uncharacterized protein n=1 Tax=Lithospermum erythrorhizon TaxID=34254 RepID=A0AAV3Q1K7_LITER
MVKPQSEEVLNEGGGSYLSIEKAMKKKKKRKNPPLDNDASNMVASNADPSLLVRVPHDNRVNVDVVLDKNLQLEVENWGLTNSSLADKRPCGSLAGKGAIEVAPQTSYVVALSSELDIFSHGNGCDTTKGVSKCSTVAPVSRSQVGNGSIGAGLVAPQSAEDVQIAPQIGEGIAVISEKMVADHEDGGDNVQTVPVLRPCVESGSTSAGSPVAPLAGAGLVFKAGGSGLGYQTCWISDVTRQEGFSAWFRCPT